MKLVTVAALASLCVISFPALSQQFSVRELVHVYERQHDYDYVSRLMDKKSFVRIPSDSLITYVPKFKVPDMPVEKLILFPKYKNVQYLTNSYDIFMNWGYELRKAGYHLDDSYSNPNMPSWKFIKGDVRVFVAEMNGGKYYVLSILPPDIKTGF